mmetsp:Transcript_22800/g.25979  ORF Transcript_22800/g.25979 Transcript_22800/m.25979 type:complete len:254 (+) Transcript_22800:49-810(+)
MQRRKVDGSSSSGGGGNNDVNKSSVVTGMTEQSLANTSAETTTAAGATSGSPSKLPSKQPPSQNTSSTLSNRRGSISSRRNKGGGQLSSLNSLQSTFLLLCVVMVLMGTLSIIGTDKNIIINTNKEETMLDWTLQQQHGVKPPEPEQKLDSTNNNNNKESASRAMMMQPSDWVEGEKKLKKALTALIELQKEGKHLGVPILTRWLGDDFPVWPKEGQSNEEWEEKRKAKYEEMRLQEEAWRKEIRAQIFEGEE